MHLIQHPNSYKDGARVLLLKGRHKDGRHEQQTIMRVTTSVEQFERRINELANMALAGERIYASAGARSLDSAIRLFKERQLAADYDADPHGFYLRLEDRWASALSNPRSQAEKVWLFDCDNRQEIEAVEAALEEHYDRPFEPYVYPSKSGWHTIVHPFNKGLLGDKVRKLLHENAIMLWGY